MICSRCLRVPASPRWPGTAGSSRLFRAGRWEDPAVGAVASARLWPRLQCASPAALPGSSFSNGRIGSLVLRTSGCGSTSGGICGAQP